MKGELVVQSAHLRRPGQTLINVAMIIAMIKRMAIFDHLQDKNLQHDGLDRENENENDQLCLYY